MSAASRPLCVEPDRMIRRATGDASAMGGFRRRKGTEPPDNIRAAEEHFRRAQEAGGIGTWEWNLATGRMIWSAQMFRNFGLCPDSTGTPTEAGGLASVSPELLLAPADPEDRARVASLLEEYSGRAGPLRIEYRIVRPDGAVHWIVLLGNVTPGENSSPAAMLGISIDSTRRREVVETAEAALRDRERR